MEDLLSVEPHSLPHHCCAGRVCSLGSGKREQKECFQRKWYSFRDVEKTGLIVVCQAFDRKTQHFNKKLGNECIFDSNKAAILKCAVKPCVLENHFSPTYVFLSVQVIYSACTPFESEQSSGLETQWKSQDRAKLWKILILGKP